jgi:hypothetical protein
VPIFSPSGHIAAGIAGAGVSVDQVPIDLGGGTCWLDDETALYQCNDGLGDAASNWFLRTFHRSTQAKTDIEPKRGASFIIAGGGRWAATLVGYGTYGALGYLPLAGVRAAGFDGTLAICENYQSGLGLSLYAPDGTITTGDPATVYRDARVIAPDDVVYVTGAGGVATLQGRRFAVAGSALAPKLITVDGEEWLAYWTEALGIIAHPAYPLGDTRPLIGYVLAEASVLAYNYDLESPANGQLRVVYSTTQGERAQDIVTRLLPMDAPRTDFTPPPPPPDPAGTVTVEPPLGLAPLTITTTVTLTGGPTAQIRFYAQHADGTLLRWGNNETTGAGVLPQAGTWIVWARLLGTNGRVVDTLKMPVLVRNPAPIPVGKILGINAMFGEDIGEARQQNFVDRGVMAVRTWIGPASEPVVAELTKYPALRPLYTIEAYDRTRMLEEARRVPIGAWVELGNEDSNGTGVPGHAHPKMSASQYAASAEVFFPLALERQFTVYYGAIPNMTAADGLPWLTLVRRLCPWMTRFSVHNYDTPNQQRYLAGKIQALLGTIGNAPFLVSEFGCKCGPKVYSVKAGWKHETWYGVTEAEQLAYLQFECRAWFAVPSCEGVFVYQENSGGPNDFGLNGPPPSNTPRKAWDIFKG